MGRECCLKKRSDVGEESVVGRRVLRGGDCLPDLPPAVGGPDTGPHTQKCRHTVSVSLLEEWQGQCGQC